MWITASIICYTNDHTLYHDLIITVKIICGTYEFDPDIVF